MASQAIEETMLKDVELESSDTDAPIQQRAGVRPMLVAKVLALVALAVTFVLNVSIRPRTTVGKLAEFQKYNPHGVTVLDTEEDPCKDEPQLNMFKITHNNLAGKGPGTGDEGMVFEGEQLVPGEDPVKVELHVNAVGDTFEPAWVDNLGFHGDETGIAASKNFMSINVKPGTEVTVKFKVTAPGGSSAKTLDVVDLTFFDIDKHEKGNEEYVKVKDFNSQLTYEGSELAVTETGHWTTYTATKSGTGADNPTDPLKLTEEQLQRAFTVQFKPFTEATVTLGNKEATGTTHGRRFDFIAKPSLRCAAGVDPNKVTQKNKFSPQCCIVKVMSFGLMCCEEADKQWYHFMCDPVEE